jgi:hypothetical protein
MMAKTVRRRGEEKGGRWRLGADCTTKQEQCDDNVVVVVASGGWLAAEEEMRKMGLVCTVVLPTVSIKKNSISLPIV